MARLTDIGWNEFHALPLEAKRPYLERVEGGSEGSEHIDIAALIH